MADYNSSLPVRTENNGDIVAKIADGTTPSQQLSVDASGRIIVKLDDGSGNLITSQASGGQRALDVGLNVAGVQIDPRQIRALTSADVVTANQGAPNTNANAWFVHLTDGTNNVSALSTGELKVSVTQALPAGSNTIGAVNQGTSPWITSDLADGSVTGGTAGTKSLLAGGQYNSSLPTLTTGQQAALQTDSNGRLLIGSIASALPAGTNLLGAVNLDIGGSSVSNTNPVPVYLASTSGGTQINKYNTTAAVAAAATTNHDYSVTSSKTFTGRKVWASASGKIRADVIASPDGTTFTNVVWTAFNSTAAPNITIDLDNLSFQDTGAGAKVRVIITNLDKAAMDVYSTISGTEA